MKVFFFKPFFSRTRELILKFKIKKNFLKIKIYACHSKNYSYMIKTFFTPFNKTLKLIVFKLLMLYLCLVNLFLSDYLK